MMFLLAPIILASHSGFSMDPEPAPPEPIIGGEPVETCAYPAAVSLESPSSTCSGSLIHPELILTAAHCGTMNEAHFGESWKPAARTVQIQECHRNPDWSGNFGTGTDFQYCRLANPVHDVPIVPVAMGCELDALTPGREVIAVGFGRTQDQVNDYGIKRAIAWALGSVNPGSGTAWVPGVGGKSTCSGDSGGPLYLRMGSDIGADDSWRLVGINSWKSGACSNGTGFVLASHAIPWVESHSGIDVTPCHDSNGAWVPGPDCGWFQTEIGIGHGSWPSCDPGPRTGPSSLCGAPVSGEDLTAPLVTIVDPLDGANIEPTGGSASIEIVVDADDGDGWGVEQVYLVVNGSADMDNARKTPPYEWKGQFPEGVYTVMAIAVDRAGLEGETQVTFGVGVEPPDTPDDPPGDGGTTSEGPDTDGGTGSGDDSSSSGAGEPEDTSGPGCACAWTPTRLPFAAPALLALVALRPRRRRR